MQATLNKNRLSPLLSSTTYEWATPKWFFDIITKEYGPLTLDVCATSSNAKCQEYYTIQDNGLVKTWAPKRCWMNPPYGRAIKLWMKKAWYESTIGAFVVCLVPARTDTSWWHEYAMRGKITFLRGRLIFDGAQCGAPFPSAIVVFGETTGG